MQSELLYAWIDRSQRLVSVSDGWLDFVGASDDSQGAALAHILPERFHAQLAFECVKAQSMPLKPQSFLAQISGQNHFCEVVWNPTLEVYTLVMSVTAHNTSDLPRDALTNLPGREMLSVRLADELQRVHRDEVFAIIMFDLDRFGWINDTLGDAVGDMALKEVAQRLGAFARGRDLAVRLEGDRFALLVTALENDNAAISMLHDMIEMLEKGIYVEQRELFITVSAGVAVSPTHGTRVESLLLHADKAMYDAKNSGEGQYSVYDDSMAKGAKPTLLTLTEIERVLANEQLELRFRPSHNLQSHTIEGVEPVICWTHPDIGLVELPDCQEMMSLEVYGRFMRWQMNEVARLCSNTPELAELSYLLIDTETLYMLSEDALDAWVTLVKGDPSLFRNLLFLLCDDDADVYSESVTALTEAGAQVAVSACETFDLPIPLIAKLSPSYIFLENSLYDMTDRELSDHSALEALLEYADQQNVSVGALQTQSAKEMNRLYNHGYRVLAGPYFGSTLTLQQLLELMRAPSI